MTQEPRSFTYKEVADTMNALRKGNLSQKAAAEEVGKLKVYTKPPPRDWVDLTPQEIIDCINTQGDSHAYALCLAVLAKSKEKNE